MVECAKVVLRSRAWGSYLSLDGTGITSHRAEPYKGTVKTAADAGARQVFKLHKNDNGTVSFESCAFPGVFLTANGTGLTPGEINYNGGGYVAAQFGNTDWEKFYIRLFEAGTTIVYLELAAFRGRYVRVDKYLGSAPNIQAVHQPFEEFEICVIENPSS